MSTEEPGQAAIRPNWWPWVHDQMVARWGKPNLARLARESGLDRSNLYTWQSGGDVEPAKVAAIATALSVNPIEAYIAAGFFTEMQFEEYRTAQLSNEALARIVLNRMNGPSDPGSGSNPDIATNLTPNRPLDVTRPNTDRGRRHDANGSSRQVG